MCRRKTLDYHRFISALDESQKGGFSQDGLLVVSPFALKQKALAVNLYNRTVDYINAFIEFHFGRFITETERYRAFGNETGVAAQLQMLGFVSQKAMYFKDCRYFDEKQKQRLESGVKTALLDRYEQARKFIAATDATLSPGLRYELERCRRTITEM